MAVWLSTSSITAVQKVITGDELRNGQSVAPYRTRGDIVTFFGSIPGLDVDDVHIETRWRYVEEVLRRLNGTPVINHVIEAAVHPAHFLDSEQSVDDAVEYLNDFLAYDGARLIKKGTRYRLVEVPEEAGEHLIEPSSETSVHNLEAINKELGKARQRLEAGDFDGAITIARTMVEAVLLELLSRRRGATPDYDGNLPKLFKGVSKELRLDPNDQDVDSLRDILRGLSSIVSGLSSLRNKMGDAHPKKYRPRRHHAVLALNAATTLVHFLFATEEYQAALHRADDSGS